MSYQPQIFLLLHVDEDHTLASTHSRNNSMCVFRQLDALDIKHKTLIEGVNVKIKICDFMRGKGRS